MIEGGIQPTAGSTGVEVRWFGSTGELVALVASRLAEHVANRHVRTLAVSGGRVAGPFFQATVSESQRRGVDWSGTHLFWADERCVAADHPDSNFRVVREHLIEPLGIREEHVHRVRGELDPVRAAREAEQDLTRVAGREPLDLVVLGMGEDGHVASLFPGGEVRPDDEGRLYIPVVGPKPPPNRITLTYRAISEARAVWVLVSGEGKREAVEASVRGDWNLPLGRLASRRSQTQIFAAV